MNEQKTNILIIGDGALAVSLAKKFHTYEQVGRIFIANGSDQKSEYYETVDIRENDLTGLLKFVIENDIKLTIPTTEKSINSDVVSFFEANGQSIFGPGKKACSQIINKIYQKKFLYRIHAQIPKFAAFSKLQLAQQYLSSSDYPVVIRNGKSQICTTIGSANSYLEKIFALEENNVLIEDYIFGNPVTIYFVTDGYSIIPIISVQNYHLTCDDNSGVLSDNVGCYAPCLSVSKVVTERVQNVASNIISALEAKSTPYIGILGVEFVLTGEDRFYITDLKTFMNDSDADAVLNLCEENLFEVFNSCVNGFFSDEYSQIKTNDMYCASVTVCANKDDVNLPLLDDVNYIRVKKDFEGYKTIKGASFVISKTAMTLSSAVKRLYDELSEINFDGMSYRKDIGKSKIDY